MTGFFVPPTLAKTEARAGSSSVDPALEWLLVGKALGFSIAEINELRIRDLVMLSDIKTGNVTRLATQDDIDALLA